MLVVLAVRTSLRGLLQLRDEPIGAHVWDAEIVPILKAAPGLRAIACLPVEPGPQ